MTTIFLQELMQRGASIASLPLLPVSRSRAPSRGLSRRIHNKISKGCLTARDGGPHRHEREKARRLRQAARLAAKKGSVA